jgi:beta-ribofuranosylaminobenzene 5'-phosphate synthase
MNGSLGRIAGGAGFALDKPSLEFVMQPSRNVIINDRDLFSNELIAAAKESLVQLAREYQFGGVAVTIKEAIPEHRGFGSKTATLLSLTKMFALLNSTDIPYPELALFVGRGGTSGVGVNIIDKGGFILDGGHSIKNKPEFAPSSASVPLAVPPLLARSPMPQQEILIVIPPLKKVFGETEKKFFKELCPIPEHDVESLSRIILMQLMPAVAESDLNSMAAAINSIQEHSWKRNEINLYGNLVRDVMQHGKASGALMAGMSSIGPGIFFIGGDLRRVYKGIASTYHLVDGKEIFLTKPNNHGLVYEVTDD